MATNTYIPIATYTIPSATASYTFSSISGSYTDLVLVCSVKLDIGGSYSMGLQFNGDTAGNYSWTGLIGNGTTASSQRDSNVTYAIYGTGNTDWGNSIVNIMNYANATTYKTCVARNNNTADSAQAWVNLWRSTAAINSVKVMSQSGSNFVAGTTFSLYGILAEGVNIAKALGGQVTYDSTYVYHTFASSGTFTPNQTLSCDYLMVGGGGGGAAATGRGGGGAGGFRTAASQSFTATNYTVTIGAGGAADSSGVNTTFYSLTATGGGYGGGSAARGDTGAAGGSGGGGNYGLPGGISSPVTSPVQGYAGGTGTATSFYGGGGGGGASAVGAAGSGTNGGAGGAGTSSSYSGSSVTYAGGGGGGIYTGGTGGVGGAGGGGAGSSGTAVATAGTAFTGAGGGGGTNAYNGGTGGSGVVVIRYAR